MKKKKFKEAVKFAMKEYYKSGYTRTAELVKERIFNAIDKAYKK